MTPFNTTLHYTEIKTRLFKAAMFNSLPNPATLWVSLATIPMLLGILAARSLAENLSELGRASEEIFRGERLPILNFPEPEEGE